MNADHERQAWEIRAALQAEGVTVDVGTCRRLHAFRFSPAWVPMLATEIAGTSAKNPEAVLAKWIRGRDWQTQMLFVVASQIGLWDTLSNGARFNRCVKLRREGMLPWVLVALWNAATKTPGIENPRAFLGQQIKRGTWVRFLEEVERQEASRTVTNQAVQSIVQRVIREQVRKAAEAPAPTQSAEEATA